MPTKIEDLAKTLLKDPVVVKLSVSKPAEKINQQAYICHENQKMKVLKELFKNEKPQRVIIFSCSKSKVKEINRGLLQMGINSGEMHSDLDQSQRDDVMFRFKGEKIDVLVATDIVARGIDIDDITMVINYDVPHDVEDYVHRVGRTARANRDGRAITLVRGKEVGYFMRIEKFLEREIEKIPLPQYIGEAPEYKEIKESKGGRGRGGKGRGGKGRGGKGRGKKASDKKSSSNRSSSKITADNNASDSNKPTDNTASDSKRKKHHHRKGGKKGGKGYDTKKGNVTPSENA